MILLDGLHEDLNLVKDKPYLSDKMEGDEGCTQVGEVVCKSANILLVCFSQVMFGNRNRSKSWDSRLNPPQYQRPFYCAKV